LAGSAIAGGGAGGGYAASNSITVVPLNTYYINVGAGGVSSTNDTVKVDGGDSWFNDVNSVSATLIAKGGAGGETVLLQAAVTRYGAGGTNTVASVGGSAAYFGGNGATGNSTGSGGGGGSGGYSSNGNSVTNYTGAAAVTGGGNGGNGFTVTSAGQTPTQAPGGGGGGAKSTSQPIQLGGSGSDGRVSITFNASAPENLVEDLIESLKSRGYNDLGEVEIKEEDVRFHLPAELNRTVQLQPVARV